MRHIVNGGYALPVTESLTDQLEKLVKGLFVDRTFGFTINFRDPRYSAETGGYLPVEIAVSDLGRILYITEFRYVGTGHFKELAKNVDFDFHTGFFQVEGVDYPIFRGAELYPIWERNFVDYIKDGVYEAEVMPL